MQKKKKKKKSYKKVAIFTIRRFPPSAAAAKSLQSCPTLCDPIDGSPLGSPVPGILQARVLEWGAIAFSQCRTTQIAKLSDVKEVSRQAFSIKRKGIYRHIDNKVFF